MICGHCRVAFNTNPVAMHALKERDEHHWQIWHYLCAECGHSNILLVHDIDAEITDGAGYARRLRNPTVVWRYPNSHPRLPVRAEVPDPYRTDYAEACLVMDISPKASAALSRRCIQAVLRDRGNYNQHNLVDQMNAAINDDRLPSDALALLHAARRIGNIAAHPTEERHPKRK